MLLLTSVLLTLTLVLCGGYAGMVLLCQIGVLPAMRRLPLPAYADAWRAMDFYLDRSMPPYKASLLLLNLATCVCLLVQHRTALAVAAALSFLLSLAGLLLTLRRQLPINARIRTLPPNTPDDVLLPLREQTVRGFTVRFLLATASFLILAVGVVFRPLA